MEVNYWLYRRKKSFVNLTINNQVSGIGTVKSIGLNLKVLKTAQTAKSAFELKLLEGWRPQKKEVVKETTSHYSYFR